MSTTDRFSGIARLYGLPALQRFQAATVTIVGLGGVGSWAAESLARSGIGHLVLVDPDDLCVTNTNRQIHAHSSTFGQPKTRALAERLRQINPELQITEQPVFFSEKTSIQLLHPAPQAVIDAIDSLRAKCQLLADCHHAKIPVICSGAAGGRRDPTRIHINDLSSTSHDSLLTAVRRQLRREHGFPKSPDGKKSPPFGIPAIFSDEPPQFPTCDGGVSHQRPTELPPGLRCDAGYGSVTHLTASFGLIAAGHILDLL